MGNIEKSQQKLFRFVMRPLTGFVALFILVAIIVFFPRNVTSIMAFTLAAPWLLIPVIALNISFVTLVFRSFTLSESIRRNHALEHGTILVLRKWHGTNVRIGGNAEADGFRIHGVEKKEQVQRAFSYLLTELKHGKSEIIISMRCSTSIGTAQGLGVVLLLLSTVVLLIADARSTVSLTV